MNATKILMMLGLILFCIGGVIFLWNTQGPFVHILLMDNANQKIESIQVFNEGKAYQIEGLKKDLKKEFKLKTEGETSYFLEVEFKDGRRIRGGQDMLKRITA